MPTRSRHQAPAFPGSATSRGAGAQSSAATATPPARHALSSLGECLSPTRAGRRGAGDREGCPLSLPRPMLAGSPHYGSLWLLQPKGLQQTCRPATRLAPPTPAPVLASAPTRPPAPVSRPAIAAKNASSYSRTRITTGIGTACPRISACFLVSRLASTVRSPSAPETPLNTARISFSSVSRAVSRVPSCDATSDRLEARHRWSPPTSGPKNGGAHGAGADAQDMSAGAGTKRSRAMLSGVALRNWLDRTQRQSHVMGAHTSRRDFAAVPCGRSPCSAASRRDECTRVLALRRR